MTASHLILIVGYHLYALAIAQNVTRPTRDDQAYSSMPKSNAYWAKKLEFVSLVLPFNTSSLSDQG